MGRSVTACLYPCMAMRVLMGVNDATGTLLSCVMNITDRYLLEMTSKNMISIKMAFYNNFTLYRSCHLRNIMYTFLHIFKIMKKTTFLEH